jgi:hypothetical protein
MVKELIRGLIVFVVILFSLASIRLNSDEGIRLLIPEVKVAIAQPLKKIVQPLTLSVPDNWGQELVEFEFLLSPEGVAECEAGLSIHKQDTLLSNVYITNGESKRALVNKQGKNFNLWHKRFLWYMFERKVQKNILPWAKIA